jgi:hypothetical protein
MRMLRVMLCSGECGAGGTGDKGSVGDVLRISFILEVHASRVDSEASAGQNW